MTSFIASWATHEEVLLIASEGEEIVGTASALGSLAHSFYDWRDSNYPVVSSTQGKHLWGDWLADYRMDAVRQRRALVLNGSSWSQLERISRAAPAPGHAATPASLMSSTPKLERPCQPLPCPVQIAHLAFVAGEIQEHAHAPEGVTG